MRTNVLFTLLIAGAGASFTACQLGKPSKLSPTLGCPRGTLFVSKTDRRARFSTVQSAILSLPEKGHATILIDGGEYHETVNVTRKAPITLLGQISSKGNNLVQIWDNNYIRPGVTDNAFTAVLVVAPNTAASLIGAGPTGAPLQPEFGNVDFKAYNIDFQNRAANYSISQALVTDISYANASFYGCKFESYQDTWYTGRNASTYVVDSTISGQTDYLFGFGTAWFQNTTLANRACGGGIVAWKGTNQTDAPGNRYGAYISESRIIRSPDANATTVTEGSCYLGRPWNDLATTVFLNTEMDSSVHPVAWKAFNTARPVLFNTTYYAEYESSGPGGDTSRRDPISHVLNASEASTFTIAKVFLERPKWIDYSYRAHSAH